MSDQIVIDRERLLVLKKRLYRAKPLSGGDYQCDQWALVMQDMENMLGPTDAAIPLCPSCKNNDVCWFGGTDVILCRHYVKAEPVKFPVETKHLEDRISAHSRDLAVAVRRMDDQIRNLQERVLAIAKTEVVSPEALGLLLEGEREYMDARITNHIYHHHEHGGLVNEIALSEKLTQYAPASQVDAIGKRLEMHLVSDGVYG